MYASDSFRPGWLDFFLCCCLLSLGLTASIGCRVAANGHNLQGVRLFRQGQHQAALQRFQRAIAMDPKNADAYYNLAATMHRVGIQSNNQDQLNQAETLYNQCLDLDEDHVDCHRGLAVLLVETGRSDRAFKLLKNWGMANPKLAAPRIELARMHEEFGDLETAKLQLQEAVQIDQHNPRAWAALASLRERSGEYTQALANYQRSYALRTQPDVARRIATLNRSLSGGFDPRSGGGTRTVDAAVSPRY